MENAAAAAEEVELLFSAAEIATRIDALATALSNQLPREVVVVSLLKGSFMFAADLVRQLYHHGMICRVEFLTVSSYGESTESSGTLYISGALPANVDGQAVLLVDDVLDTGRTLRWAYDTLKASGADPVLSCALLDKPSRRVVRFEADLVGFTIPDRFVVGYGIDYAQRYRELPYIGALPG